MKNETQNLEAVLNLFGCEYELIDSENNILLKTSLFDDIKNNSISIDNIYKVDNKYYEYSNNSLKLDNKEYDIKLFKDVTKYQLDIMKLKEDALTKLPNRYAIEMFISNNINSDMIAIICDLDDFKNINDTYGHPQGDVVLSEFGLILKRLLSQNVFVGRYGGEEFVIFVKNNNIRYVKQLLAEVRKQMQANENLWNDKYNIKVSAGMAILRDNNLKLAIKEADMALYFVKNNGKNADAIYDFNTNNCYIIE